MNKDIWEWSEIEKTSSLSTIMQENLDDFTDKMWKVKNYEFCNDIEAWQMLFEHHPNPEDFHEPEVVEEVLSVLEQMNRMEEPIWQYLEEQLFAGRQSNAKWMELNDRFAEVRKTLCMEGIKKKKQKRKDKIHTQRCVASWVYGEDSLVYEKYERKYKIYDTITGIKVVLELTFIFIKNAIIPDSKKKK